jgi:hypothetical protein
MRAAARRPCRPTAGFYVIECEDEDAAVELAREVPRSPGMVAEIRPIADT